jgi:regulator of protease activity HflC (stomatin/prohibitin superfamily)
MSTGWIIFWVLLAIVVLFIILPSCIRTLRPTQRGLIERFGKYNRFANPGIIFLIPIVEKLVRVNVTEMMVSSEKREIITLDSLNAEVDSNIYFRVKADEASVKASQYSVFDYRTQIVALAKTTLRNIIGTMTLKEANSDRNKINGELLAQLAKETAHWGIDIVRTELKEIQPPQQVQDVMNRVVIANNEKIAAQDFATAVETKADGERRASIKQAEGQRQAAILAAEGQKQAKVLVADGEAQAIKLVNESAELYFKGNAQLLRRLQAVEQSFAKNAKIVVPAGTSLVNVIGDLAGIEDGTSGKSIKI